MNYKNKNAFTLAEIMVVMVIISIIAASTIGIYKAKTKYENKFMGYAAITNLKSSIEELFENGITIPETPATEAVYSEGTEAVEAHYEDRPVPNFDTVLSNLDAWSAIFPDMYAAQERCTQTGNVLDCKDANDLYNYQVYLRGVYINSVPSTEYTCPETGTVYGPLPVLEDNTYQQGDETYSIYIPAKAAIPGELITPATPATPATTVKGLPPTAAELCNRFTELFNITGTKDCSKTMTDDGPFTTPNFTTTNGMRWYKTGSNPTYIGSTGGYTIGVGTELNNEFYIIYVDINGSSGKNALNEDIIKFYINRDGSIIAPAVSSPFANNKAFVSAKVRYKSGANYVTLYGDLPYREALCRSGKISSTFNAATSIGVANYCGAYTTNANCVSNTCEVILNKPGF